MLTELERSEATAADYGGLAFFSALLFYIKFPLSPVRLVSYLVQADMTYKILHGWSLAFSLTSSLPVAPQGAQFSRVCSPWSRQVEAYLSHCAGASCCFCCSRPDTGSDGAGSSECAPAPRTVPGAPKGCRAYFEGVSDEMIFSRFQMSVSQCKPQHSTPT